MKNINHTLILLALLVTSINFSQNNEKMIKTDKEWKNSLGEMSYQVLRNSYTERPFTGEYNLHFEKDPIIAKDVIKNYSRVMISMKVTVVGQVLTKQFQTE